jgi:hypothetical protein
MPSFAVDAAILPTMHAATISALLVDADRCRALTFGAFWEVAPDSVLGHIDPARICATPESLIAVPLHDAANVWLASCSAQAGCSVW